MDKNRHNEFSKIRIQGLDSSKHKTHQKRRIQAQNANLEKGERGGRNSSTQVMNLTRFHSRISEVITYTKLEPTTLSSTLLIGEISYNLILLCVGDLGPNLEQGERKGENQRTQKAQETQPATGWWGYLYPPRPVRPVPWTGQTGRSAASPCTRSHLTVEVLSSKRSLLRDTAMLMKIRFAVLEGPRNPGRWPVLALLKYPFIPCLSLIMA